MLLARENPFCSARVMGIHYRFPEGLSWASLVGRLQQLGNRAALVGSEGAGKTTLVEQLEPRLNDLGFRTMLLRASADGLVDLVPRSLTNHDFLLLDSAERLRWWRWRTFTWSSRRLGGLVITSHRPSPLPTLVACKTSPQLFERIVRDLLWDQLPIPAGKLEAF